MKFLVLALFIATAAAFLVTQDKVHFQPSLEIEQPVLPPTQQGRYNQYQSKPQPFKPYIAVDPVPVRPISPAKTVNYGPDQNAEVLKSVSDVEPEGFNYAYETSNGISADAQGSLRTFSEQEQGVVVRGSYSYTAPDGTPVVVTYIADENGYQPQSDLLPQAPPVPEAIARSLDFIARNAPRTNAHAH